MENKKVEVTGIDNVIDMPINEFIDYVDGLKNASEAKGVVKLLEIALGRVDFTANKLKETLDTIVIGTAEAQPEYREGDAPEPPVVNIPVKGPQAIVKYKTDFTMYVNLVYMHRKILERVEYINFKFGMKNELPED